MNAVHRNSARLLLTALATGLTALVVIALACGPSAPAGQEDAPTATMPPTPTPTIWIIDDTSPSELATVRARPTGTPWPPGYVPPTHRPYTPPLTVAEIGATLAARMDKEAAERDSGASADTTPPTFAPAPTPVPLTEQVTQFARDKQRHYDVVVRVRAETGREVDVPDSVDWPHHPMPWGVKRLMRTPLAAITEYHGVLPEGYELVTPQRSPNTGLEGGQEYVLFIHMAFASADDERECSGALFPVRICYTETQIDAIGGPGGYALGAQIWIVEGSQAWRIPREHLLAPAGSDLAAATAGGESLPLSDLETAITAGLPE